MEWACYLFEGVFGDKAVFEGTQLLSAGWNMSIVQLIKLSKL